MGFFRRFIARPPQLSPSLRPPSPDDLKKGVGFPSNAVIWTEESFQALQRFLRDLAASLEGGLPSGQSTTPPTNVEAGDSAEVGNPEMGWATGKHQHGVPVDDPVSVGVELAEQEGVSKSLSRSDHRHEVESWRTAGLTVDGGSSTVTTGFKGYVAAPYSGVITGWALTSDISGSCTMDVWKSKRTPGPADSICTGGTKPYLSGESSRSGAVAGWSNLTVSKGEIFGFNVDSATTVTLLTLVVRVRES